MHYLRGKKTVFVVSELKVLEIALSLLIDIEMNKQIDYIRITYNSVDFEYFELILKKMIFVKYDICLF